MATDAIIKKTDPIENKDRLSDLPDSVLLHILSFMKTTQYTVQTCILSKRWKNLWKQFSILTLYSEGFETLEFFIKFVSHLLFLRDQETALHTLKLYLSHQQSITPHLFERILKYVVTCNVKCLRLLLRCDIPHFPISLLSSQTLTSLAFCVYPRLFGKQKILFPNSLNLPSLIKLDLAFVTFSGGTKPFSSCPRLTKLRIICFDILGEQNLCISSTTLVKLTMRIHGEPQNGNTIELYTPSLCTFAFIGTPFKILHARQLSYVEHIKIDAYFGRHDAEAPTILLSWLLELANIKILTVSSNTLQALSLVPDLLMVKLNFLRNLKKLRVKMKKLDYELSKTLIKRNLARGSAMSEEEVAKLIVEFLLQNSPSVEVCYLREKRWCD